MVEYKYNIDEHIVDDKRDLIITDRKMVLTKLKSSNTKTGYTNTYVKYYKYKCNRCGWESNNVYNINGDYLSEYWTSEIDLFYGKCMCSVCNLHPLIVSPEINSIIAKEDYLWMIDYFQGTDYNEKIIEASKYLPFSNKKYNFVCPLCGRTKTKRISKLNINHSLGCICSDGVSYPNKFAFALFQQLPINNYIREYSPEWAGLYKYDNYFIYNNQKYIVEMDGELGHGNRQYKSKKIDTLGKQRDEIKDELAKQNSIYIIRINCKLSTLQNIKENIVQSELSKLFDLSQIDWDKCDEFATQNLIKEVCDYFNSHPNDFNYEIAEKFKIDHTTVGKYLKKGNNLGWCNYNSVKNNQQRIQNRILDNLNPILVIKDNMLVGKYKSASEIERCSMNDFGVKLWQSAINLCLKKHNKYKGFLFEYEGEREMKNVMSIFNQIKNTKSIKDKKQIINNNKNNQLFLDCLKILLSNETFGISESKINKPVNNAKGIILSFKDIINYLKMNNTGTDKDISMVQKFIANQPEDIQDFYKGLITKSIKLGCDAKIVNQVLGKGFIPTFEIMLANKYFDKPERVKGNFTLTEKLDGFRLATVIHNDKIEFYSRQGQFVEGLIEVEEDMKEFCKANNLHNAFFDGELVAVNCENISSDENYKIVTKTARSKGIKRGLKYNIFDTLRYEDFVSQECDTEYYKRRCLLNEFSKNINLVHINILPVLYNGDDTDMIMEHLNKARENHKEGIMINLDNGMYEFKRSNNLLKVKVMQDADLRIVDVYEGTGKNKGKLGGIIIEFIYEGNTYRCECGSGFSDDERVDYWNNPEKILNKIATIQYFEISKNDDGGYGLRFPVWTHRIREDKTEISMN